MFDFTPGRVRVRSSCLRVDTLRDVAGLGRWPASTNRPQRDRPCAGETSAGLMYALLQIYPLEARGDDDPTPLDAIAVDGSQERLEEYLVDYQERYRAACAEFAARDPNPDGDWTSEHDCLSEAIMNRHAVYGALMVETTFKIVEVFAPLFARLPRDALTRVPCWGEGAAYRAVAGLQRAWLAPSQHKNAAFARGL